MQSGGEKLWQHKCDQISENHSYGHILVIKYLANSKEQLKFL